MRYCDSIFGHLLKPISRQWFAGVVARHEADAYDKEFRSWDHLALLIFAQLGGVGSLRGLEAAWNANAHHHYHLGVGKISRSTVSDANARRPLAVFTETFAMLSGVAGRRSKREGEALLSLIDSSPIPLGKLYDWAKWNGRIRGLKLHTVYEPACDNPTHIEITDANINDMEIGEQFPIKPGFTHVFDKGYCKYPWWTAITRPERPSSRARRHPPAFVPSAGASSRNAEVTASRSSTTQRSSSSAKVIPGFPFPCAASACAATTAPKSPL